MPLSARASSGVGSPSTLGRVDMASVMWMPAQCAASQRADRRRHRRAPVAALRAVARIAQALHQLGPGRGDAVDAPAGGRGLAGEAEARQRRADHVEGIGGVAAMRDRIDQRLDHLVELDDRARPAMGDDQRHRAGMRRARMDEMDVEPVDRGGELRKAIEQRFACAPVVVVGPVAADLLRSMPAARPGSSRRPARASGQRVRRSLDFRSSSTSSPTAMRKGFTSDAHATTPRGWRLWDSHRRQVQHGRMPRNDAELIDEVGQALSGNGLENADGRSRPPSEECGRGLGLWSPAGAGRRVERARAADAPAPSMSSIAWLARAACARHRLEAHRRTDKAGQASMILVGQYNSPYTRRVAVSLDLLGFAFEHDTRSVFADFNSMRHDQSAGPHSFADPGRRHDADQFGSDPRLARPAGRTGARAAAARRVWRASRRCSASRWRAARSTRSWASATSA